MITVVGCAWIVAGQAIAQLIELAPPSRLQLQSRDGQVEPTRPTPYVEPAHSQFDAARVRSAIEVMAAPNVPLDSGDAKVDSNGYLAPLGAREVGCQAAVRWSPAIGLRRRAQTIRELYCDADDCKRQAAAGIAQFLNLQAAHQEDLAAATAMRAYYTRIALQEQQLLLHSSSEMVALELKKQQRLMEQGLPAGVDLSSFDRQQIDLDDQSLQARASDEQLRRLLASLAGLDYHTDQRTLEPLTVQPQSLECERLVGMAIQNRYDLQSWRCLYGQINEESAPMFANLISTSVGSFGIPLPKMTGLSQLLCCGSFDKQSLAQNLRSEVQSILETNQRYASQLVFEKCSQLQLAYERLSLQQKRIESWEYRLGQLGKLEELGDTRPDDRAKVEAGLLRAKFDEVARRMDAKLAEVSLAEVVGGLAVKCCCGEAWLP